jgi:hypothetical protein
MSRGLLEVACLMPRDGRVPNAMRRKRDWRLRYRDCLRRATDNPNAFVSRNKSAANQKRLIFKMC